MVQEYPDARVNVPIHEIVVREEHLDERWPEGLGSDVSEFVDRMLSAGRYPLSAIPRDAVLAAAVWYFITTFEDEGLHTFIDSIGWDAALVRDLREGLKRFGFDEFDAIVADTDAFIARADPEFFEKRGWWKDPALEALDARYPPSDPENGHYVQLADQIRRWPFLRSVPSVEYQDTLQAYAERNRDGPA